MIPLRLELKNFMSYGEEMCALDLSGMHTLCLSGENGHGKSALLDAITWCLWGESRAGKNKHDDLVRIGADEMSVEFTFAMDGQTYRVLRKRSRRASGNQWELQQAAPEDGWRSLTGNNSGETEKAIQKLLRMTYDTFLNSAYLRQGQADQFVRQPPGKRKEILADILDLSRYDQLEAKARERAREAAADATDFEREINIIDAELRTEGEHRAALVELEARRADLHAKQDVLRAEWESQQSRKGLLESQQQLADRLRDEARKLDEELAALVKDLGQHQAEADSWRAMLERREEICRDYEALQTTRQRAAALEESVEMLHRGQQSLAAAEKEWMAAENEIQRQCERAVDEHEQALGRLKDYPGLKKNCETVAPRVAAADRKEVEREQAQAKWKDRQEHLSTWQEESARLTEQCRQWEERLAALAQQQGTCSVCNSPLPPDKIAAAQEEYEKSLALCTAQRKQVWAEARVAKEETAALEQQIRELEAFLKTATQERVRLGQWEQHLHELDTVQATLPNLAAYRAEVTERLENGAFAPEVRVQLEKITRALKKYATSEADYRAAKARLSELADAERLFLQLEHAQAALATAEQYLERTQKAILQRQESRAAAQAQLQGLPDVGAELAQIAARELEIRAIEAQRKLDRQAVDQEIGSRQEALARCEKRKQERAVKEQALATAKKEQEVHDQLAKAFGKKGVQALIIENAIPELQDEANRLLERLTDGDMSIFFETLRAAKVKKDSPIETLDIKVSDNLGTRPLEMYSGGEGFRAAFALRIALSKLLARRAGAKLQTLIIDEGFGTQDGKGREKLVDALNAIKGDFEKIIVITHIDELKDVFPTRVEVIKTPTGSQITVLEGASG